MSIYASWPGFSDENHEGGCAIYEETSPGVFDFSGRPCDCGVPNAPIVYEGSHVLPSDDARRGGEVSIASIPGFITRDGRDDKPDDDSVWPWLRLGVYSLDSEEQHEGRPYQRAGSATVVLNRRQVAALHAELGEWLELSAGGVADGSPSAGLLVREEE